MKVGPEAPEIQSGRIIAGKYRVERVLGAGGQGTVVVAMHLRLRQRVAIKIPHTPKDDLARPAARLLREARAAFRLQSEHVARIIDVDVVDGAPFIVMEYLDGVDLKQLLARRGPLPVAEAIGFLVQACDALAEAHELGIVHRDLKPSNLFVLTRSSGVPSLKVLDFGLSKVEIRAAIREDAEVTQPALVLGSPRYMSPEQIRDPREVDSRADIWSLGTVLQEMLTGEPVFRARNEREVLAQILKRERMPLSLLRSDVPPEIERVVWRCTQREREHRFADVREVVRAVAPYAPDWAAADVQRMLGFGTPPFNDIRPLAAEGGAQPGRAPDGSNVVAGPLPGPPGQTRALERRRLARLLCGAGALTVSIAVLMWANGTGGPRGAGSVERRGRLFAPALATPTPSSAGPIAPRPARSNVELIPVQPSGLVPVERNLADGAEASAPAADAAATGTPALPIVAGALSLPLAGARAAVRHTADRGTHVRARGATEEGRGASPHLASVRATPPRVPPREPPKIVAAATPPRGGPPADAIGRKASAPAEAQVVPADDPLDGRK